MALRGLHNTLKTSLVNNDAFNYAHLVKFEKPTSDELRGEGSNAAGLFSYITDGAFDIVYDDGSVKADGTPNGPQNYIANKLKSVGTVTETVEAKASSMSLTLDTSSLGASITSFQDSITAYADGSGGLISFDGTVLNLIDAGFREGDKIKFTSLNGLGSNDGKTAIIEEFNTTGEQQQIFYKNTPEGSNITAESATGAFYSVDLVSEELTGIIRDVLTDYTTYKNRKVFVYKAHCDPLTNAIIGEPYLLFKGIIAQGSVTEDPTKESKITWTLTSHWGDFSRVSGRLTLDEQHRALTAAGIPDQNALVRPEYAGDLGFIHANQAISVIANYNALETSYKQVDINGFWFGGKRLREVESTVQRRVDLEFNLTPKYLPIIYGVNKIDSIPVFVDTDRTLTADTKVYVAYAISEGQVSSLFDIYVDGVGGICVDDKDSTARGEAVGSGTTARFCRGRMDQGNTLVGTAFSIGTPTSATNPNLGEDIAPLNNAADQSESQEVGVIETNIGVPTLPSTGTTVNAASAQTGILHEQQDLFTSPMNAVYMFHAGKPDQNANPLLKSLSAQNKFKIQDEYYDGASAEYWGSNHRLLDTAYVVAEYTIADGETTIPEVDFIVRGKGVECFNYDLSYTADSARNPANREDAFNLGDVVTLKKQSDESTIASNVTIIDKWTFIDVDGNAQTRFRTDHPTEITVPHYMDNGTQRFHFAVQTGTSDVTRTAPTQLAYTFSSSELQDHTVNSVASGKKIVFASDPGAAKRAALAIAKTLAFTGSGRTELLKQTVRGWTYDNSSDGTISNIGSGSIAAFDSSVTGFKLKDIIVLHSDDDPPDGTSDNPLVDTSKDDYYNGYIITLKRFSSTGVPFIQKRKIIDYDATHRIAVVDHPWNAEYLPTSGDTYVLSTGREDRRVTTNPAMQLLDYLTNERYGRGLDIDNDIDLDSFKEAARQCDTRSKVTVIVPGAQSITVGHVMKYPASGDIQFQGTVESFTLREQRGTGTQFKEVVFKDVIGKLGMKWRDWKTFGSNQLVWNDGLFYTITGQKTTVNALGSADTSLFLRNTSTSPETNVTLDVGQTASPLVSADGNPIVKSFIADDPTASGTLVGTFVGSGYDLYDADGVKYWKYVGWDDDSQRNATRHQMNQVIPTSNPVFDNINLMLNQFNGILRYSNGKYALNIRSKSPDTFQDEEIIEESDIIGSISLKDGGIKKAYNSVNASIKDPQLKFETRSVSFFNSEYLKEDRNIQKQGTYGVPGITNYYNARLNIKQQLDESRFGITISFKMMPKGALLLPGSIIRINYPRFSYSNKEFRISNITTNSDCTINITAEEHNNAAYLVQSLAKPRFGAEQETGLVSKKLPQTYHVQGLAFMGAQSKSLTGLNSATTDASGSTFTYSIRTGGLVTAAGSTTALNSAGSTDAWGNFPSGSFDKIYAATYSGRGNAGSSTTTVTLGTPFEFPSGEANRLPLAGGSLTGSLTIATTTSTGNTGAPLTLKSTNSNPAPAGTRYLVALTSNDSLAGYLGMGTGFAAMSFNAYGASDYRLKTDIQDMSSATTRLLALKPRNFKWISNGIAGDGFIAHELAEVVPEAVIGEKDGEEMQLINQSALIPILVKTIQELEARIAVLEG